MDSQEVQPVNPARQVTMLERLLLDVLHALMAHSPQTRPVRCALLAHPTQSAPIALHACAKSDTMPLELAQDSLTLSAAHVQKVQTALQWAL